MPTARTTTRSPSRNAARATRSASRPTRGATRPTRKPSRLARRQPPPSLASKVGNGAMAGLLRTGGAARQNKSKVAMIAGLGAAGAALLKRRRGAADETVPSEAVHTPPETNAFVDGDKAQAGTT